MFFWLNVAKGSIGAAYFSQFLISSFKCSRQTQECSMKQFNLKTKLIFCSPMCEMLISPNVAKGSICAPYFSKCFRSSFECYSNKIGLICGTIVLKCKLIFCSPARGMLFSPNVAKRSICAPYFSNFSDQVLNAIRETPSWSIKCFSPKGNFFPPNHG